MTGTYQVPPPAPPRDGTGTGSAPPAERAPLCAHCGAIGTHYLTCASLRLPAGYRVAGDPEAAGSRLASGPRHPDWPLPPQPCPPQHLPPQPCPPQPCPPPAAPPSC
jgi:hypothetical protein